MGRASAKEDKNRYELIWEEPARISTTVETLQLWSEKMLATGVIDPEACNARKNK